MIPTKENSTYGQVSQALRNVLPVPAPLNQAEKIFFDVVYKELRSRPISPTLERAIAPQCYSLMLGFDKICGNIISVSSAFLLSCRQTTLNCKPRLRESWMRSPSLPLSNASP
ncbi:MAG TPA: hypothetical protein V6D48_24875 [Oculatellaceae cyanobacterium]